MAIGLVEDKDCTRLDRHRLADLDIVDGRGRDLDAPRVIGRGIVDDVELETARAPIPLGPTHDLLERDWGRIDEPQHLGTLPLQRMIRQAGEHGEGLREDRDGPARVGIRQRRASHRTGPEMIVMMRMGVPDGLESAQALNAAKLGEREHDEMVPAPERFVVGVSVVPLHRRLEPAPRDRFEKAGKDAMAVLHARFPPESRQPEGNWLAPVLPGMRLRHSDSFPGRSCACAGTTEHLIRFEKIRL